MTPLTRFGKKLDYQHILPEYPRPMLVRDNWLNLNGPWEYQITKENEEPALKSGWKTILVPFALGSLLSGSDDRLLPHQILWCRRSFTYPVDSQRRIMLNFEAVDQECEVFLNGLNVGHHEGGYSPFSLNVTNAVKEENELLVKIKDASDQGIYAYGKQVLKHGGMWYTPSSGIYGTVWMESLPEYAIEDLKITPDPQHGSVYLRFAGQMTQTVITVFAGNKLVHRGITNEMDYTITLSENDLHLWSPSDPFLYRLYLQTEDETVRSYFAMRSFSSLPDSSGHLRFALNGKPLFLSGLLDQGYTMDGLLTYPSQEAMEFELKKIKDMGFNMIRKHVKVENRRWYSLCDELGILVMQDMPSGGGPYNFKRVGLWPTLGRRKMSDGKESYALNGRAGQASRDMYMEELYAMLDTLYNCPCIFAWVPFNEGWGQFDSKEITEKIKDYDNTRLVDSASGWFDQRAGDFLSIHDYFFPLHVPSSDGRIVLLSEFGGYTYVEFGHSFPSRPYGYKKFKDKLQMNDAVFRLYEHMVYQNISKGLSGCIYTQLADVEDECNGLFTADREIVKIDEKRMRRMNEKCIRRVRN